MLEFCIDDGAAALLAEKMGDKEYFTKLSLRSKNYKKIFSSKRCNIF